MNSFFVGEHAVVGQHRYGRGVSNAMTLLKLSGSRCRLESESLRIEREDDVLESLPYLYTFKREYIAPAGGKGISRRRRRLEPGLAPCVLRSPERPAATAQLDGSRLAG